MSEDRCTGHCCRAFNIGPHEQLQLEYERMLARKKSGSYLSEYDEEVIRVYEMVIPLPARPRGYSDNGVEPTDHLWEGPAHDVMFGELHTCKNLTSEGDCGIYETRPKMCRNYPNKLRCVFIHCTSKEARSLPDPYKNRPTGYKPNQLIPTVSLLSKGQWWRGKPMNYHNHACKIAASEEGIHDVVFVDCDPVESDLLPKVQEAPHRRKRVGA